ncbi:MAG TPA: hypothetical protein VGF74_15615, partial [Thermoleophilaceae bacterium]
LRGREQPLAIYGPPGLRALYQALAPVMGKTAFEVRIHELEPNEQLVRDGYTIAAYQVEHRVTAYGYALIEEERPGRFDEARARELGVEPGPDFGKLQQGETVGEVTPGQVLGEPRAGRKVVIAGDTMPCDMTAAVAHGADLLVHEATFSVEEGERAHETGHSTARGVAELARTAEVKLLALNHISQRYAGRELRDEAREVFPNTIVPRDFDRVELPFPERGEPVHVKGDRGPASPPAAVDSVESEC